MYGRERQRTHLSPEAGSKKAAELQKTLNSAKLKGPTFEADLSTVDYYDEESIKKDTNQAAYEQKTLKDSVEFHVELLKGHVTTDAEEETYYNFHE
jgi:hypothetical protein